MKLLNFIWQCCIVGKAASCSADIPDGHRFKYDPILIWLPANGKAAKGGPIP